MTRSYYEKSIAAAAGDADELGHVNNAIWVRWIQDMATEHWRAAADPDHVDAYVWVVVRHEIDYLRAVLPGETVTGRTWVGDAPRGARFDRHVEFTGADGKPRVRARTTWAMLDKATRRPLRVPDEVAAQFSELPGHPLGD
ncbi:MAG: acyl-CoA thioesterase [Allosphingosinicella sp.]